MKPFIIPWRKHSAITCESLKYYGRTLSCEGISPSFGASLRCTWVNLVQISCFVHQIVFFHRSRCYCFWRRFFYCCHRTAPEHSHKEGTSVIGHKQLHCRSLTYQVISEVYTRLLCLHLFEPLHSFERITTSFTSCPRTDASSAF